MDKVGSMEEIGKSLPFSEASLSVLTKYIFLACFPRYFSWLGVIQNEYNYVQEGTEPCDMCMYANVLSLFVFWQHRYVISNEKPINTNKNPSILIQNLEFRSRYQVF